MRYIVVKDKAIRGPKEKKRMGRPPLYGPPKPPGQRRPKGGYIPGYRLTHVGKSNYCMMSDDQFQEFMCSGTIPTNVQIPPPYRRERPKCTYSVSIVQKQEVIARKRYHESLINQYFREEAQEIQQRRDKLVDPIPQLPVDPNQEDAYGVTEIEKKLSRIPPRY